MGGGRGGEGRERVGGSKMKSTKVECHGFDKRVDRAHHIPQG